MAGNDRDQTGTIESGTRDEARRPAGRFALPPPGLGILARLDAVRLAAGAALELEIDAGRGFLWLPVAFAVGILVYFTLPSEPLAVALLGASVALGLGAWRQRHGSTAIFRCLLLGAMLASGACIAKIRTDLVAAPRLERQITGTVTGWVEGRDARRGGYRLTIRVAAIEGRRLPALPVRVTVTVRGKAPAVGSGVTLLARLRPSSGPVLPGGYDFGLPAFYRGIGATGFAYGAARQAEIGPAPLAIRLLVPLEALREGIRARIDAMLPGDVGRIATALTIGDAGGISEAAEDDLRESGLAHVLSVSGLHMVLVAGAVFWTMRAGLALIPALALRRPIKKWAAAAALAVTSFYLLISGLDVAAQRSFIMIFVAFLAILLDRRAISMRNVAVAAMIVLAIAPESLLAAGFQMSFAATVALVAGFEAMAGRRRSDLARRDRSLAGSVMRWLALLVGGMALTSLLGGLGTTPFALYHFQRMAPLSIIANVAAMPLVDFLVMPLALLSVLLMPFGLEAPFLAVMGFGIEGMLAVAREVSEWSRGTGGAAMPSAASLLIFVAGFLWLCLMGERWRFAGLAPMLLGGVLALYPARPGILVMPDGRQVAIRSLDGRYRILARKADHFVSEVWLRSDGDPREARDADLTEGTACDEAGCIAALPDGRLVALALSRDAFADDCRKAALVVTPLAAPPGCAAATAVIDRAVLEASGAIALVERREASMGKPSVPTEAAEQASSAAGVEPAPALVASIDEADELDGPDPPPRRSLDDEDIVPGGNEPRARGSPISRLEQAFEVSTAFPRSRRPWMPVFEPPEEGADASAVNMPPADQ